jgi:hypothetical protein
MCNGSGSWQFRGAAKTFCDAAMETGAQFCDQTARPPLGEAWAIGGFALGCLFSVRRLPVRAIPFAGGVGRRYNPGPQGGFGLSLSARVSKEYVWEPRSLPTIARRKTSPL